SANSDKSNYLQVSDLGNGAFNLAWEDGLGGGDKSFNDLVLNAQMTNHSSLNDWAGLRQGEREIIDLTLQADVVSASFVVNREAAYDNFVGFYNVVDLKGGIDVNGDGKVDLDPGDAGYAQAAIAQRVDINLSVPNQGTANITGQLPGGGFLAPFMITNGTPEAFLAQNASNQPGQAPIACFSYLGANPDGVDHIRLLADNTFGFEDLFGGGDKDFNDLVVQVNIA
ncbi:MAG: DUF4114 domain-containing protein, partial [Tolypothrix sp. T3-bin4]|nr:DUF4114 domain-containing protein [Tolypothrix sp. T3-bin4]